MPTRPPPRVMVNFETSVVTRSSSPSGSSDVPEKELAPVVLAYETGLVAPGQA